jgi:Flp pilus assembly protein TadG
VGEHFVVVLVFEWQFLMKRRNYTIGARRFFLAPQIHRIRERRQAGAAVELAVLLPVLALTMVISLDWARVFYYSVAISNAARQGAIYASDSVAAANSPYANVEQAALADTSDLNPQPTVSSTSGVDGSGNPYVEVTVAWTFSTITKYPGIDAPVKISRTVRMRVAPTTPN